MLVKSRISLILTLGLSKPNVKAIKQVLRITIQIRSYHISSHSNTFYVQNSIITQNKTRHMGTKKKGKIKREREREKQNISKKITPK